MEDAGAAPPRIAKRRRLPADERRKEILDAARKVFVRDGLQGARTRDIATEAKVNIATLFHYFNSKDELFDAAVLQPLEAFVDVQVASGSRFPSISQQERETIAIRASQDELRLMLETFPLLMAALFSSRERGSDFYVNKLYPRLLKLGDAGRHAYPAWVKSYDFDFLAMSAFAVNFMLAMDAHYRGVELDLEALGGKVSDLLTFRFNVSPPAASAAVATRPTKRQPKPRSRLLS